MAGGRPRTMDREAKAVLHKIFFDEAGPTEAMKVCNIKTRTDLLKAVQDDEVLKRMRWKDPDQQQDELMSDDQIEELKELPSFLNWLQNNHGTLPRHPVDISSNELQMRVVFDLYLNMTPAERQTNDPNGVVSYDVAIASESEKRNKLGAYAPGAVTSTTGGNNLTTPDNCRSAAAKALYAFEKKIKPNENNWTKFQNASEWTRWKIRHMGILTINDMDDLIDDGIAVPEEGVDDADAVKLYKKKNTLLFMALQEAVETNEGLTIVKRHSTKMDGATVWKELSDHYDTNIAAIVRTKYLFNLICTNRIPANHKGLAAAIDAFMRWVIEHNYFCKPSENITEEQQLIYFERYIDSIEKLRDTKKLMDVQEDTAVGSQVLVRSPAAKIDFYYRQAQQIDAEFKTSVINSRRKINATLMDNGTFVDEGKLWDMDVYSSDFNVNAGNRVQEEYDMVDAADEAYRYINVGEVRRHGQMPKENWQKLPREFKQMWLKFPIDTREDILTSLLPGPPPSTSEDHRIPGTGVSSRNARATNAAETEAVPDDTNTNERSVNMGYIQAMRARSTAANSAQETPSRIPRDPFAPARLMSRQNKSPNVLVPIKRGEQLSRRNVSMASALQQAEFPDILSSPIIENRSVNMAFSMHIRNTALNMSLGSCKDSVDILTLVDGGANSGLGNPKHLRLLWYANPPRFINVTGIVGNKICQLPIASFAAKVMTSEGSQVILVFHEYGEIQNGHTIHSKIQMSSAGSVIGDLPLEMGGTQSIVTRTRDNSVTIPMTFKDGLSFIETSYPTKEDLEKLPWIEMTQSEPWDPTVYDGKCSSQIEESNSTVEVRDNDETVLDEMKEQWETVYTDN